MSQPTPPPRPGYASTQHDCCPSCGGGLVLIHNDRTIATDVILLGDPDSYVRMELLEYDLLPDVGEESFDPSDDWQAACEDCDDELYANTA